MAGTPEHTELASTQCLMGEKVRRRDDKQGTQPFRLWRMKEHEDEAIQLKTSLHDLPAAADSMPLDRTKTDGTRPSIHELQARGRVNGTAITMHDKLVVSNDAHSWNPHSESWHGTVDPDGGHTPSDA